MRSIPWLSLSLITVALAACGGSDSGSGDTTDSSVDALADTTVGGDSSTGDTGGGGDSAKDTASDTAPGGDTGSGDVAPDTNGGDAPSDGACACAPDWCGCGTCDPTQIVCTKSPPGCPLGCASSCPQLATTTCSCESDRCVRSGITGDIACYKDPDCPPGDCCAHAGPVGVGGRGRCRPDGDPCCGAGCP